MIVSVSLINAETALNGISVTLLDTHSVCEVLKRPMHVHLYSRSCVFTCLHAMANVRTFPHVPHASVSNGE